MPQKSLNCNNPSRIPQQSQVWLCPLIKAGLLEKGSWWKKNPSIPQECLKNSSKIPQECCKNSSRIQQESLNCNNPSKIPQQSQVKSKLLLLVLKFDSRILQESFKNPTRIPQELLKNPSRMPQEPPKNLSRIPQESLNCNNPSKFPQNSPNNLKSRASCYYLASSLTPPSDWNRTTREM